MTEHNPDVGLYEGETCNRDGCKGTLEVYPVENCYCHINPPCGACTAPSEYCPTCYWEAADDD